MPLLSRLERRLGRFAVPHLTLGLVLCQVVVYLIAAGTDNRPEVQVNPAGSVHARLQLVPSKVLEGEVWRLVTIMLLPPRANPLFAFFFWYFFWLMGSALEQYWGNFRYNLYLLVGWAATVAAAFLTPDRAADNVYLESTVFLAFAWLNPEFPIFLFFVLAVPIKWIARVTWGFFLLSFALGPWQTKAQVAAAVANFLLFFGVEIVAHVRTGRRRMVRQTAAFVADAKRAEFFHRCKVCGITDRTHPNVDFRYCSKCAGQCCYCADHLRAHEHVTAS